MVNTGAAHMTEKLQAALNQLATSVQAQARRTRVRERTAPARGDGPART